MALPIRELNSQTSYNADGVTTVWDFSFAGGYIDKSHVFVQKLEVASGIVTPLPIAPGDWIGPFQLSVTPPVAVGFELTIYRNTPKDLPLVDFQDKANLTEASLDLNARQAIFVAAESADGLNVAIDSVSQIVNYVATAQAAADTAVTAAATTGANVTAAAASAAAAAASQSAASGSATAAANSATASANSATASANSATTASTQAGNASASATAASNSATAAATSATNASNSASTATTAASTAGTQAGIATTQAGNAATSASTAGTQAGLAAASATDSLTYANLSAGSATASAASATAAAASAASIAGGPVASIGGLTGAVTVDQLRQVTAVKYPEILVNGHFRVNQSNQPLSTGTGHVACDMWRQNFSVTGVLAAGADVQAVNQFLGKVRTLSVAVFNTSVQRLVHAAGDFYIWGTGVEQFRIAELDWGTVNAKPVTLAFLVKSNAANVKFDIGIRNQDATRSYITQITTGAANTEQEVIVTIPGCTTGSWAAGGATMQSLGLTICVAGGTTYNAPAGNVWQSGNYLKLASSTNLLSTVGQYLIIGAMSLREGNYNFVTRMGDYTEELRKCQRYFEVGTARLDGYQAGGSGSGYFVRFRVEKFRVPGLSYVGSTSGNLTAWDARNPEPDGFLWYCLKDASANPFFWAGNWQASCHIV